ncbi:hypothetical protein PCASD_23850 [Puccinia coronata f. sp. avenae]|uniref:Uncharacterized protein n=1 Tax=Puccinia coronata f. sp. avenae TaxID=200324 RepID=A0A2N5TN92_9BASI|nr:hypothetical protein PCASD_23850 [Puccinia coronata f. sp. avenae]
MVAYREELACLKKQKEAKKEKKKANKKAPRPCSQASQSQATTASGNHSANADDVADTNGPFIREDFQNICSYLEDKQNYKPLYGTGSKTDVGGSHLTKAAAYDVFAIYMNDHSNKRLHLTGKQLRLRLDRYKEKFRLAKDWAENTGAGVEEQDGTAVFNEALEACCPCYERLHAIFGTKANITPLEQYQPGPRADLYDENSEDNNDESDELGSKSGAMSSPEVEYSGWNATLDCNKGSCSGDVTMEDRLPEHNCDNNQSANDANMQDVGTNLDDLSADRQTLPFKKGRLLSKHLNFLQQHPLDPLRPAKPTTLAGAFEKSNDQKYGILKNHINWEKQKFKQMDERESG